MRSTSMLSREEECKLCFILTVRTQQTVCWCNSRCLRWQQVLWRSSGCPNKKAVGAAKASSHHGGKLMWIGSSVNPGLTALLMQLCCLPFVTKGQPPPIKTPAGNASALH